MTGWDRGTVSLPSSHVFVTAAWGRHQRTVALPRWALGLAAMATVVGLLWSIGCTVYVAGHDSLIAAAMKRERNLQYDYEDRITALQRQLDKSLSQQSMLERSVNTRLDLLTAQEGELRRKAGAVAGIAEAVQHLAPQAAQQRAEAPALPVAPLTKPAPDHDAKRAPTAAERASERLSALTSGFSTIERDQQSQMTRLQTALNDQLVRYRGALSDAGLDLGRFTAKGQPPVGGPFVPLDEATAKSPFERASLTLRATLDAAERLRSVIVHVPFAKPLDGNPEVTSPFGARLDPFLGRPALHTGVDLREDSGAEVHATAPGRVTAAGPESGYGNMVEVDHGAGLRTRYAHLSSIAVSVGQTIDCGDILGRVGATGRATGPHLHYETRIDGEPVDPIRFLQAGARLAAVRPTL